MGETHFVFLIKKNLLKIRRFSVATTNLKMKEKSIKVYKSENDLNISHAIRVRYSPKRV